MRNVAAALLLVATSFVLPSFVATPWGPAIPSIPPGGFATISVEGVQHGQQHVPPAFRLRVRSTKEYAVIVVKLNGSYVSPSGTLVTIDDHSDILQWEFVEALTYEVDLKDLAPGVHHLEINRGVAGISLPLVNEHDLWFSVGE